VNIYKKVIPQSEQRYNTTGDWWFDDNGDLQIRCSDLGNEKIEFEYMRHEEIEAFLCKVRGITQKMCDDFDMKFDLIDGNKDKQPGDAPDCPYRKEHFFSDSLNRFECVELGIEWEDFNG
jgi:hypothetical protein